MPGGWTHWEPSWRLATSRAFSTKKKIIPKGVISKTAKFYSFFLSCHCLPHLFLLPLFLEYRSRRGRKMPWLSAGSLSYCGGAQCTGCCCCVWKLLSLLLFLFPTSAYQLCVGGCYFVRGAVGILNSPVIISEEMHIMVVWQQQSEVTQFHISETKSHLVACALSLLALPAAIAGIVGVLWGRPSMISVRGRVFLLHLKLNLR